MTPNCGAPFVAVRGAEGAHVGHVDVDAFGDLRRAGPVGAQALGGHPANALRGITSWGGSPDAVLSGDRSRRDAFSSSAGAVPASMAR